MSEVQLSFYTEDIEFNLSDKDKISSWINHVLLEEGITNASINYIFCSDKYLLTINQEYLNHDTYTDIITFDQSETKDLLEADIYLSIERIKENAIEFGQNFTTELKRVMVHGLLHLLGHTDKTDQDKETMRIKEDACLSLYEN